MSGNELMNQIWETKAIEDIKKLADFLGLQNYHLRDVVPHAIERMTGLRKVADQCKVDLTIRMWESATRHRGNT